MELNVFLDFWHPSSNGWDEIGGVIWSGIRYPDDTFELLANYEENEDKIGVVQSDFEKHWRYDEEIED